MNTIDIVVQNSEELLTTIHLRNHPFVNEWFEHFKFINNKFKLESFTLTFPIAMPDWNNPNFDFNKSAGKVLVTEDELIELLDSIVVAGEMLNLISSSDAQKFPYDRTNFPDKQIFLDNGLEAQQYLNQFHRYFTNAVEFPENFLPPEMFPPHSDYNKEKFIKGTDAYNWVNYAQQINVMVHKLDHWTITPNVINCPVIDKFMFKYDLHSETDWLELETFKKISDSECIDICSVNDSKEYNVWITVELLGKEYLTGFLGHDDPREWDITFLNMYTGSFEIVTSNNSYIDICQSEDFNHWLEEHNMKYDRRMCGISIGKVAFDELAFEKIENNIKNKIKLKLVPNSN